MLSKQLSKALDILFSTARRELGTAVKSKWVYVEPDCPGCRKVMSNTRFKGKGLMRLNAFFYQEHGVLIAYVLCADCAKIIFSDNKGRPSMGHLPLHDDIEKTLKAAYLRKSGH